MKDELVSLQTAKLAKEKGLKLNYCRELFYPDPDKEGEYVTNECSHDWEFIEDRDWYSRPTQSLLKRWLREVHGIDITIHRSFSFTHSYHYCIIKDCDYDNELRQMSESNRSYEVCLEDALLEGLKMIKKK